MSTHTDPRCEFLIKHEQSKLGWMDDGPQKQRAMHMIKVRVLSMPWNDMLEAYAKTKWERDHGRIRVIQHMAKDAETGEFFPASYVMEQNVNGQWTKVPVTYTYEGED